MSNRTHTLQSFPAPESSRPARRLTPGEHRLDLEAHTRDTVRMLAAPCFDADEDLPTIRSMRAVEPCGE